MFSTLKQKLLLILYVIIILAIPIGTYFISQYQTSGKISSNPSPTPLLTKLTPKPPTQTTTTLPDLSELDSTLDNLINSNPLSATQSGSNPTVATSFGPTLSFKVTIEGRPTSNQSGKVFLGIMDGDLVENPKFLLNFLVDVPQTGEYNNLSISGLNPGSKYTALLKGTTQIATSSAFIMSPTQSKLNNDQPLNLLSGDLNEDNIINTADYSLAQNMQRSTSSSQNWNENADFNKDGIINIFDTSIVLKNVGKIGASGSWAAPLPTATPSASLMETTDLPVGSVGGSSSGYWIWIPK